MHWRRKWQATPVFLPGESQGRGSLVGYRLWGRTGLDTTERLHFHFSLSCIGEGNGNPLQCYCLENPRDGEAWWATVYGVAQSGTPLKRLSSSSSSSRIDTHACLLPAFCLYESFSQRIHLIRVVRKCRKDNSQGRQNKTTLSIQQIQVSLVLP